MVRPVRTMRWRPGRPVCVLGRLQAFFVMFALRADAAGPSKCLPCKPAGGACVPGLPIGGMRAGYSLKGARMGDDERTRRREFARMNHPDHGGDPAVFIAGWHQFDPQAEDCHVRVVGVPHRRWLTRLLVALLRFGDRRNRAPRVH